MASDLTERLAEKLRKAGWAFRESSQESAGVWVDEAPRWLPLLLSEPELVAGLGRKALDAAYEALWATQKGVDPETGKMWLTPRMEWDAIATAKAFAEQDRLSVLTPRERAVMKLGEADVKRQSSLEAFADPEVLGDDPKGDVWLADNEVYLAALAEVRALTTEVGNG